MEWDLFGVEVSLYQANESFMMPSDSQRIEMIKFLLENGYEDKVVIAHDVHTKHRLVSIYVWICEEYISCQVPNTEKLLEIKKV